MCFVCISTRLLVRLLAMAAPTPPPTPTTTIVQPTPTPTVVPVPARKSRRTCIYTLEERAVLGVYKREYKASTNHHERGNLLRNRLLPAIFNHWYQKDQVMPSEDVALKRRKVSPTLLLSPCSLTLCAEGYL